MGGTPCDGHSPGKPWDPVRNLKGKRRSANSSGIRVGEMRVKLVPEHCGHFLHDPAGVFERGKQGPNETARCVLGFHVKPQKKGVLMLLAGGTSVTRPVLREIAGIPRVVAFLAGSGRRNHCSQEQEPRRGTHGVGGIKKGMQRSGPCLGQKSLHPVGQLSRGV